MGTYMVAPRGLAPVIRQGTTIKTATARAAREFPQGVESVRLMGARELAELASRGVALPASARTAVAAFRAVQAYRRQVVAAAARRREAATAKAWAKKEEERAAAKREKQKAREDAAKAKRRAAREVAAAKPVGDDQVPAVAGVEVGIEADEWDGESAPW